MSFYEVLSKYYDILFPLSPQQVNFIREKAGLRILDIAAGTGELALELAREGYAVAAIDLEHGMTRQMLDKKEKGNIPLEILTMDMRNIDHFTENAFDTILCLGNSLVHLDSKDEISNVLSKAAELLTKQGQMVIQIVNYDRILKDRIQALPILDRDTIQFVRTYEWREPKILFNGKLIVRNQGEEQVFQQTTELFPLTSDTLKQLLMDSGFHEVDLYGSYLGEAYDDLISPAIIVVAHK